MANNLADAVQMHQTTTGTENNDSKIAVLHEHGDVALGFLENHDTIVFTPEEERQVVRKIDRVLMPLVGRRTALYHPFRMSRKADSQSQMIISYTIQFMDKSVMAQSAIYDLLTSLKLVGQDYSWCS